ncbi:MAG TPA: GNAT family N-acetyltransferase [Candidatus Saccharimonadales bacterium]|nr:GNAT family N-acetyltransferase [Candidatus Saccharimonadales bacterium]
MTGRTEADTDLRVTGAATPEISAAIIEEVAAWGASEGFPSWTPGSFTGPESIGMSRLHNDIATASLHLVWRDGDAVATFSLLERDPLFWPAAGDEAMYLHRFAVRRAAAGAGRRAVEWCLHEAQQRGRLYVRLDCLAENPGIRRYYERFGFTAVDEAVIDATRYSLYEVAVPGASARVSPARRER